MGQSMAITSEVEVGWVESAKPTIIAPDDPGTSRYDVMKMHSAAHPDPIAANVRMRPGSGVHRVNPPRALRDSGGSRRLDPPHLLSYFRVPL